MPTYLMISVAPPPLSKSQQLGKLLPGIEAALAQGHSHKVIYEHIKTTIGLELTYKYYKTTLHRIRKRRGLAETLGMNHSNLPRAIIATATPANPSGHDAVAAVDQPRRFKYDVKGSVDEFF